MDNLHVVGEEGPPVLLDADDVVPVKEGMGEKVTTLELFRFAEGWENVMLAAGSVGAIISASTCPAFGILTGGVMQEVIQSPPDEVESTVRPTVHLMLIFGCVLFFGSLLMQGCFSVAGERQTARIRRAYFQSLLRQEPAWLDLQKPGMLTALLHADSKLVHDAIGNKAGLFLLHLATVVMAYATSFFYCWRLALVLLAVSPLLLFAGAMMILNVTRMTATNQAAYARAGAAAEEALGSIKTVHVLSAHHYIIQQYNRLADEACNIGKWTGMVSGAGVGISFFCMFGCCALGLYYASYLLMWGMYSFQDIFTALMTTLVGSFSVGQLFPALSGLARGRAAAFKIFRVIDRKPRVSPGTTRPVDFRGHISFNKLTFRYPSRMQNPIVRNLSLDIEPRTTVAFVGASGCGKSSLISILQRFYEPAMGYYSLELSDGTLKVFPYEHNLKLLDAFASRTSHTASLEVPITRDGTLTKQAVVRRGQDGGLFCSLPHTNGPIRREGRAPDEAEDYDKWYWVEAGTSRPHQEILFPPCVSQLLTSESYKGAASITINLGFGVYSIDLHKMTRTNLESRVHYEQNGDVSVDGVPLAELDPHWWKDQIGAVAQEPVLFNDTVMENVRMGKPDATDEEVKEACRKAFIHNTIEQWPDKYKTKVGEGGCQISGGQKQRIAIARAIIRQPRLLVLDEATSALDRATEMKVQSAFNSIGPHTTSIVIAHRLQTICHADKIVVLQPPVPGKEYLGGTIVQIGTHAELLADESGVYRQLWDAQTRGSHSEPAEHTAEESSEDTSAPEPEPVIAAKDEAIRRDRVRTDSFSRIAALCAPWFMYLLPAVLGAILLGAIYPLYALFVSRGLLAASRAGMTSEGVQYGTREDTDKWVWLIAGVGGFALVGSLLQYGMFGYLGAQLTCRMRKMLFAHLMSHDMSFHDMPENSSGALASVLSGQAESVRIMFGDTIGLVIVVVTCLVLSLGIAFSEQWELALVVLVTVPFRALAGLCGPYSYSSSFETKTEAQDRIASEGVSNLMVVSSYNLADSLVDSFGRAGQEQQKKRTRAELVLAFSSGVTQFSLFAVAALGVTYGATLIARGETDAETVITVVLQVVYGSIGVGEALATYGTVTKARLAAAHIFSILDTKPKVDQMDHAGVTNFITDGAVSFRDVTFRYPTRPGITILDKLTWTIGASCKKHGMQVGLIGTSGCGKSTALRLLQRLYPIEKANGHIDIDGTDLSTASLQWWRSQVGVVSQEPALFGMTIAENIQLGNPQATFEEIKEAARLAHVHHDIEQLPDGYLTNVGARGSLLSGGQKQRVAIARAIVKKPRFLLLDEATSALDNESEKGVQATLDNISTSSGATTITIAHKLTTIQNTDKIAVLDKGKLIEEGTHSSLIKIEGGAYQAIHSRYHSAGSLSTGTDTSHSK